MITVFRKSTVRPWPSVSRRRRGSAGVRRRPPCAPSRSRRGGRRSTAGAAPPRSAGRPPRSRRSRAGAPTSRATVWRSWYSDMSRRTMARSSSNMNSASARASSVFPTPVGPRKTNEPIGRFGSCRGLSAHAWARSLRPRPPRPGRRPARGGRSSMWISFSVSPSSSLSTGIGPARARRRRRRPRRPPP